MSPRFVKQAPLIWRISRWAVERGNVCVVVDNLSPFLRLQGEELTRLMGTVHFEVSGYGYRLVFDEPAVRYFLRAVHERWPHWLFFCDLNHPSAMNLIASLLPTVQTIRRQGLVHLTLQSSEVLALLKECVPPFERLCRQGGLSEEATTRTKPTGPIEKHGCSCASSSPSTRTDSSKRAS